MPPPTPLGPILKKELMVKRDIVVKEGDVEYAAGRKFSRSRSRDMTPKAESSKVAADTTAESAKELAAGFRANLTTIKSLVTCSICDQLLYEPWTLSCGHTYCYSCLCNWFVPNRNKKTCPECRSYIRKLPAPAFIIKQMVEIFTKQTELMPEDESIEQHNTRRLEEMADVERDKGGVGLFKNVFQNRTPLRYDISDGVFRCSSCGTEHEGGPQCETCGAEIDDGDMGDFSDMDGDADLGDLDDDSDVMGHDDLHYGHFGPHGDMFGMGMVPNPNFMLYHHLYHHHLDPDTNSDNSEDELDESDDSDAEGSLQDFVVQDDADLQSLGSNLAGGTRRNPVSLDSEDESDEGGAVSNRRLGRRQARANRASVRSTSPSELSAISIADSTESSEIGDFDDEATMLRNAGWSPLDQGNDSDAEQGISTRYGYSGYAESEDDLPTEDEEGSDTETIGHGALEDEDDDRSRDSVTPNYQGPYHAHMPVYGMRAHPFGYADDYPSDGADDDDEGLPTDMSSMDQDGDTEMSVSPGFSRESSQFGTGEDQASRGSSEAADGYNYGRSYEADQDLGTANALHEVEEESSDSSIRPITRRRPRTYQAAVSSAPAPDFQYNAPPAHSEFMQPPDYNPRLSSMFAEHQQRVAHSQGLDDLDPGGWRVEVATTRDRRRTPSYQTLPRRYNLLRSHHSPSVTRVSHERGRTGRAGRTYRQYLRNERL